MPRYFNLCLFISLLLLSSCSSEVINDDKEVPGSAENIYPVYFHIGMGVLSRAGENIGEDVEIDNLYLSFYKSTSTGVIFDRTIKAGKEGNLYRVDYVTTPGNFPDYFCAAANIDLPDPPGDISTINLNIPVSSPIPLGSLRYFSSEGIPLNFTALEAKNFTADSPVELFLERAVAKVSLNIATDLQSLLEVKHGEENVTLSLIIDGWGLTALDSEYSLLKNIGLSSYRDLTDILGPNEASNWIWNHWDSSASAWDHSAYNSSFPIFHWAFSKNYTLQDFPDPSENSENILFARYSDMTLNPTGSQNLYYAVETTRPASAFGIPNALPMAAITGHYQMKGADDFTVGTFYRESHRIWLENEIFAELAARQISFYDENGEKLTPENLSRLLVLETPDKESFESTGFSLEFSQLAKGCCSPVLKSVDEIADFSEVYDLTGNLIDLTDETSRNELNKALIKACGIFEKYEKGKCVFLAKVKHLRPGTDKTGCFGIVRNHLYEFNVESIEGWGRGVTDENMKIGEMGVTPDVKDYILNLSLSVDYNWIEMDGGEIELMEK